MRKQELHKIAEDYQSLLSSDWNIHRTALWRHDRDWIEYIDFRPHPYLPIYLPVHCFDYLKENEPFLKTHFMTEVHCGKNSQPCEVKLSEHSQRIADVFNLMVTQFEPSILSPLDIEEFISHRDVKE